jgi:hypothetical protein
VVNAVNDEYEHGDLVLEEICQGGVTQADAVAACQGVPHNLTVPSAGDRVMVSGSYVLDADHGWMEIHPVTSLAIKGSAPPSAAPRSRGGCPCRTRHAGRKPPHEWHGTRALAWHPARRTQREDGEAGSVDHAGRPGRDPGGQLRRVA